MFMSTKNISILLVSLHLLFITCYESPKPSMHALRCMIDIYKRQDFFHCGSQVTARWNLTDHGNHDHKQKCCSIFDLWDCIEKLAQRLCSKKEYFDVQEFKTQLIDAANKKECKDYNYHSNQCAHEERENMIL